MALVIYPDGRMASLLSGTDDPHLDLKVMQDAVGGYIEIVESYLLPGCYLVVRETGKLDGLPVNELASAFYRPGDPLCGNAILAAPAEVEDPPEPEFMTSIAISPALSTDGARTLIQNLQTAYPDHKVS